MGGEERRRSPIVARGPLGSAEWTPPPRMPTSTLWLSLHHTDPSQPHFATSPLAYLPRHHSEPSRLALSSSVCTLLTLDMANR